MFGIVLNFFDFFFIFHTCGRFLRRAALNNSIIPVSLGPQPLVKRSVDFGYDIDIVRGLLFDEAG